MNETDRREREPQAEPESERADTISAWILGVFAVLIILGAVLVYTGEHPGRDSSGGSMAFNGSSAERGAPAQPSR